MSSGDSGASSFGVFSGALGVATFLPLIWTVIKSQLPSTKFKTLEQTLLDTETLLRSIVEEGLQLNEMPHYESNLMKFRSNTERIREETYRATSFWQQVCAWFGGLSSRIGVLCDQIQDVRASICESSAEARARLAGGEVDMPMRRGLLVRLVHSLRRLFAFLRWRKSNINAEESLNSPSNVMSLPQLAAPACAQAGSRGDAHTATSSLTPVQSNADSACAVPAADTVFGKKHIRQVLRVISRLEQKMSTHRVHKAALRKILRTARRQRSTLGIASSAHTTRSRKSRGGIMTPARTAAHTVVLSQARESDSESDDDSWEDELVIFGKTDAAVQG